MTSALFVLVPLVAVMIIVLVFVGICFAFLRLLFSFGSRSRSRSRVRQGSPLESPAFNFSFPGRATDAEPGIPIDSPDSSDDEASLRRKPDFSVPPMQLEPLDDASPSRHHHHLDASITDCERSEPSHSTDTGFSSDCGASSSDTSSSGSCDCGSSSSGGDGN